MTDKKDSSTDHLTTLKVDMDKFDNSTFDRGASMFLEAIWLSIRLPLFLLYPGKLYGLKATVLRALGAKIGRNPVIKPGVRITFPWKLTLGDNVQLGEESWLLNLDNIEIESNACISQRAMLCTGNHNYKSVGFNLITGPIKIEEGAWIAMNAWVGPNLTVGSHAILSPCSVTTTDLEANKIYRGNPAEMVGDRVIEM